MSDAPLKTSGWGPFRLPGEEKRLRASRARAERLVELATEIDQRSGLATSAPPGGAPVTPVVNGGEEPVAAPVQVDPRTVEALQAATEKWFDVVAARLAAAQASDRVLSRQVDALRTEMAELSTRMVRAASHPVLLRHQTPSIGAQMPNLVMPVPGGGTSSGPVAQALVEQAMGVARIQSRANDLLADYHWHEDRILGLDPGVGRIKKFHRSKPGSPSLWHAERNIVVPLATPSRGTAHLIAVYLGSGSVVLIDSDDPQFGDIERMVGELVQQKPWHP